MSCRLVLCREVDLRFIKGTNVTSIQAYTSVVFFVGAVQVEDAGGVGSDKKNLTDTRSIEERRDLPTGQVESVPTSRACVLVPVIRGR